MARWFLIANGLLLPFIALQMYVHSLIWIAALWAVTFPGSTWTLARLFRRMKTSSGGGYSPVPRSAWHPMAGPPAAAQGKRAPD